MRALPISLAILILLGGVASAQSIPAGAIVAFNEGKRLMKERRTDDAIQRLQQAVELAPAYGEAWTELGNAHLESQRYAEAVRSFETALKVKPEQKVARYNLAFALRKLGKHREASEQYRLYLQRQSNDADAHYGLAESLRAAGDMLAAAEAYETYARTEKNPAQQKWIDKARETAAKLRAEAKTEPAPEPAVAAAPPPKAKAKPITKAKAAPEEKTEGAQGGLHLSFSAKSPEAVRTKRAVEPTRRNGSRPDAFRAGLTYLQNGDYAAALPRLQTADREKPNDGLILAAIASAHLGLEQGEQAESMYQRAIASASEDALPGLYLGLGEARRLLGKRELALDAYNRVLAHARSTSSIKRFSRERIDALK